MGLLIPDGIKMFKIHVSEKGPSVFDSIFHLHALWFILK